MTIIWKSLIYNFGSRTGAHYVPRKDYVHSDSEFELINLTNTGNKVKVPAALTREHLFSTNGAEFIRR